MSGNVAHLTLPGETTPLWLFGSEVKDIRSFAEHFSDEEYSAELPSFYRVVWFANVCELPSL